MKINIHCSICKRVFEVERTSDIPDNVDSLVCNWCPNCSGKANEDYREWYRYKKKQKPATRHTEKQLKLF